MPLKRIPEREWLEQTHRERLCYMSMLCTRFTLPHLVGLYKLFDGDLGLPIVLGEIAMRNLQGVFQLRLDAPYEVLNLSTERLIRERRYTDEHFRPANALSIAMATGIPRETVRRKVEKLLARGWITRNAQGHLFLVPKCAQELAEFDREEMIRFMMAACAVLQLMESPGEPLPKPAAR